MGFDVYGLSPKENTKKPKILNEDFFKLNDEDKDKYFKARQNHEKQNKGEYFRNNVWWWRPLWDYVCEVCEDVMSQEDIEAGHSNSGYEVSESTVDRMVEKLLVEIALGNHFKYEEEYTKELEQMEDVDCNICDGTGKRLPIPRIGAGDQECNGCNSTGKKKHFSTNYPFNGKNVEEFVEFLSESGGIQIC